MRAQRGGLTVGVAVLAGCCGFSIPALAGSGHNPTAAQNHQAAARDAAKLLERVNLPAGATPSSTEPTGDGGTLADPPVTQRGAFKVVYEHAWWTAHESPDDVFKYVEGHPPSGGTSDTSGGESGPGSPTVRWVGFSFPARAGVLGIRWLVVEVVRLDNGTTGIRADAQVQWIIPRSASEVVPDGVREIDVVRRAPGQPPSVSKPVTRPSKVHKISSLIDGLPILQPGVWSCPAERSSDAIVTFAFRRTSDGPALARATVRADVGNSDTGCDAMSFSVDGRRRPALVQAASFLRSVQRLLGVQLTENSRS